MGGWNFYGSSPSYGFYGTYPTYPYSMVCSMHPAYPTTVTAPITIDKAVENAQRYIASLNNPDLAVGEVEEYSLNFYVQYYERSTNVGAFEMLIDKYTGRIYPEPDPNMMWNTKYGMMSGMMGRYQAPTANMPVTIDLARAYAQQYLNTCYPGTTVGEIKPSTATTMSWSSSTDNHMGC